MRFYLCAVALLLPYMHLGACQICQPAFLLGYSVGPGLITAPTFPFTPAPYPTLSPRECKLVACRHCDLVSTAATQALIQLEKVVSPYALVHKPHSLVSKPGGRGICVPR